MEDTYQQEKKQKTKWIKYFLIVVSSKKQVINKTYIKVEDTQCGDKLHIMDKKDFSQVIFELLSENR